MAGFEGFLQNLDGLTPEQNTTQDFLKVVDQQPEDAEYEQLKRWWTQELASPGDLMPYDADIIDMHVELLQGQEDIIESLLEDGQIDEETSLHVALEVSVYRMEMDRLRYLLADLARIRLAKIERFALHMRTSSDMIERMSDTERSYLQEYGRLMERHFQRTVLEHLPKSFRAFDKEEMIDRPDLDEYVFCHVLETVTIETGDEITYYDDEEEAGAHEHDAGASLIVRYRVIKEYIDEGKIVLLY